MAIIGQQLTAPEAGWKRINDTDSKISYVGAWTSASDPGSYQSSVKLSNALNAGIVIKFYGTKFRYIGYSDASQYSTNVSIKVDGVEEIVSFRVGTGYQLLQYEKLNLSPGVHTIEITNKTTSYILFDAIDIDDTGYFPAQVGQVLAAPELGWRRIEDSDPNFTYTGWGNMPNASFSGSTARQSNASGRNVISFKFTKNQIRLIFRAYNYGANPTITIDGITETIKAKDYDNYQVLVYEKTGLNDGEHIVFIESSATHIFDAIDINESGVIIKSSVGQSLPAPESGWKRYDDNDVRMQYDASYSYSNNTGVSYYNNTRHITTTIGGSVKIKFYGTKIRLLSAIGSTSGSIDVLIDGINVGVIDRYGPSTVYGALVYEKTGLPLGVHEIEFVNKTTNGCVIDAVDIDDIGDLLGTGYQSTSPESGWRRFDDNDSRINYKESNLNLFSGADTYPYYNSTVHYNWINATGKLAFKFYGTKLRVLSSNGTGNFTNNTISIDGVIEEPISTIAQNTRQLLSYEKVGLALGVHTVTITLGAASFGLDAIDIDSGGYLLHPILNQVSKIEDMKIGDCIPCTYVSATSGAVGPFSKLGDGTGAEIPVTGSATPNGTFYFIKADKGLLISDRVIQHTIAWDTLNNNRLIEGGNSITCIPIMTSDTAPEGIVEYSSKYAAGYEGYLAFDKVLYSNGNYWNANAQSGWISYQFKTPKIIRGYAFKSINGYADRSPKEFTFEGWDGTQWIVLDTKTANQTDTMQKFTVNNNNAYIKYRLNVKNTYGGVISLDTVEMYDVNNSVRSISGGVAYADASGYKSISDQSKGAFPVNNEWDKYIVNSNLNGKITKGDDNVWHWNKVWSYVKETPVTGLQDATGSVQPALNTNRILRGGGYSAKPYSYALGYNPSNLTNAAIGFRPVLEYLEPNSKAQNMFY